MGILDSLENSPELKSMLGQLGAAVIPAVLGEVMGNGGQGGLSAIVAKLEQAGLGDQVKSWIGTGQNLPITAEQLQQVLAATRSSSSPPGSTFRSTSCPRCWPRRFPVRSTARARTASCRIPPEPVEPGSR
jgi:hypothetical protein